MSIQELIVLARRYGITFFFQGDEVIAEAAHRPEGKARELIELLRSRKEELFDALHREVDLECEAAMAQEDPTQNESDPILTVNQWLPEYLTFRKDLYQRVKDTAIWAKNPAVTPILYVQLKEIEAELDALKEARLSEVMELLERFQEVVLHIQFEHSHSSRKWCCRKPEQGKLDAVG